MMTALILIGHAFCFLSLRRIVGERLSLASTLAASMSYWVFANAVTIMSEPPSMALMWVGVWVLTGVREGETEGRRWGKVIGASFLMLGAAAARDAVVVLAPGFLLLLPGATRPGLKVGAILFALGVSLAGAYVMMQAKRGKLPHWAWGAAILIPVGLVLIAWGWRRRDLLERWLDRLRVPLARREAWGHIAVFAVVIGGWVLVYRYPPKFLIAAVTPRPTTMTSTTMVTPEGTMVTAPIAPVAAGEGDEDVSREGRYKAQWLYGVPRDARHLLTEPPVLGGRWVCEGLVAATNSIFESKVHLLAGLGYAIAVIALILSVTGLVVMLRRGHWWLLGAAMYFLVIWLQWGIRIKPRYMIPIAPLLFLLAWAGLAAVVSWGRLWRGRRPATATADTKLGWGLAVAMVALVAIGNAFPWWVEYRVRHTGDGRDFYDAARRGAFAQLVDIGAWAQKNIGPHETIWMNAGAQRRIAYFLTGRRIETKEIIAPTWGEWTNAPGSREKYDKPIRNFRRQLPAKDRFIIVYVDHPIRGVSWPGWHWPLKHWETEPVWWKLYTRSGDQWAEVKVPRQDRSYVRGVPVAGM
jgi:hypothetical protein